MEEIQIDSVRHELADFIRKLTVLLDAPNTRIYRLSSGHTTILIEEYSAVDCDELLIKFVDFADSKNTLALFLTDSQVGELDFEQITDELSKISDLIVLPTDVMPTTPEKYVPIGRIEQHLDDTFATEYVVLKRGLSVQERLVHTAPLDIGETTDSLSEREKWFQRKHSTDN